MNKTWLLLIPLLIALLFTFKMTDKAPTNYEKVDITPGASPGSKHAKAKFTPGRVVEFKTTKGNIDFVLYEKDCPDTTSKFIKLIKAGSYDNIKFGRVEPDNLIQTTECKELISQLEARDGLVHEKGSVAIAPGDNPNSKTSSIYILQRPRHDLDYEYTVFGRVIRGMDVVLKIEKDDVIKSAGVRNFTRDDNKQLLKVLQMAEEDKVNG